jgi:Ca2+/Na+ antiporter
MQISLATNMLSDIDNRRRLLDKTIKRSYIYTVVPIILLLSYISLDSRANLAAVFISNLFIFIFVYLRLKLNKERASLNRYIEEQRQFI